MLYDEEYRKVDHTERSKATCWEDVNNTPSSNTSLEELAMP